MFRVIGTLSPKIAGQEGTNSTVRPGDSGGAALREGQLVGVTSADDSDGRGYWVNLTHPDIKAYLDTMAEMGADIRYDGEGTMPWEECFDVKAEDELTTIKFDVPHTKVTKVTGIWSNCFCDGCLMTDGRGYLTGPLASVHPEYSNVPDGALLVWGAQYRPDDAPYTKAGFWQGTPLPLADISFKTQIKMHHAGNYASNQGLLKVCFH